MLAFHSAAIAVLANTPPAQPTITEPAQDGMILNPADVHMETAPFSDVDVGDTHLCTDWEIWSISPAEPVWVTACIGGVERLHTHFGDGVFSNSLAAASQLLYDTEYRLRVRHRDSSGDPGTEWSGWAERTFVTSSALTNTPGGGEWAVRQPGYVVEVVVTNLQLPVNIAFVPNPGDHPGDPFFYVTELYGAIKVVTRDLTVSDYATNLLNFDPGGAFPGSGEQGLAGIVVDPASGDVFAGMMYDAGGPHYPKVVRFQSNDGGLTAATQTTILDMVGETQGQSHQISHFSIGPDGKLYVHMGDGFTASTAQDTNSFRGKILRMNLDGSPVPDNPFHNPANGTNAADYIFAYGFRNPFGGAWRAADTNHYELENGPNVDRIVKTVPGRNYLWDGSNASMTNYAIYTWGPSVGPVNLAFVQPETFGGSGFPPEKMDHAFVSESGPTYASGVQLLGKRISEFVLDLDGNRSSGPSPLIEYNGTGKATVVGLAAGPDGLYFTDLYKDLAAVTPVDRGARVLRVRYVGAPPPPLAGDGDGLRGEYFDNIDLTSLALTRTDATVDFNWMTGSPSPAIGADTFSVRWTGQVQPQFNETYTFYTVTDDGVRLWVDGQLLVDRWANQSATERGGSLSLAAYKRYDLQMEFFENGGDASAKLSWSSPATLKSVIPQSQLYSSSNAPLPFHFEGIGLADDDNIGIELTGVPGDVQQVEMSTNLVDWTLFAVLTNVTGHASFEVPFSNGFPQLFLRSLIEQPAFALETIVDNPAATVVGTWPTGNSDVDKYGTDYYYRTTSDAGAYVQFTPSLPVAGDYQVYEWHTQVSDRTTNATLIITFDGGSQTNAVNQQMGGGVWNLLGTFPFQAGNAGHVRIAGVYPDPGKRVGADAIRFVYQSP